MNFILSRSCNQLVMVNHQKCYPFWLQSSRNKCVKLLENRQKFLSPIKQFTSQQTLHSNNISNFYKGSNIFITGATGFVGKSLLEKLLRSCGGLENVYVLIREKKRLSPKERLKILLDSPVFDILRKTNPGSFGKVKALYGDVAEPYMGLKEADRKLIMDEVNIVFHSAATVKFNEDLPTALKLNTSATIEMVELCKNMKNLKSFIHVSTAYCNSHEIEIKEEVVATPYTPSTLIQCVKELPPKTIAKIQKEILGEYSTTYLFSKALAENVVLEYSKKIPVAIVRPSAVQSTWKEPFPGWIEVSSGGIPFIMQCGRGLLKSFFLEDKVYFDAIPVDVVANTLIAAAWHSSIDRSSTMKIYNCTSSQINGILCKEFMDKIKKYFREYPTVHVLLYPSVIYTNKVIVEKILNILLNYIPAAILDLYLYANNQKPVLRKYCRNTIELINDASCAIRLPLNFHITTFKSLIDAVEKAEDGKEFNINMYKENGFDWDAYYEDYVLGIRKYLFKDDISTLSHARTKLNRLYWMSKTIEIATVAALISLVL